MRGEDGDGDGDGDGAAAAPVPVPQRGIAESTAFTVALPPWTCSSRTSSPVTVLGAGKYRTSASGSRIPSELPAATDESGWRKVLTLA